MSLTLMDCKDKEVWDQFVSTSPQENIFCTTPFLDSLEKDYDLLLVSKEGTLQIGAVVLLENGSPISSPIPFSLYQGILFDQSVHALPSHSRSKRIMETTDYLLAQMGERYNKISLCLHHGLEDLRSFQWFNYHQPELGQFQIDLRYTGLLDLEAMSDFDSYLSDIRRCRKREYKRARSEGWTVEESDDIDALDQLHDMTFERQGIERNEQEKSLVRSITKAALDKKFGRLIFCRNEEGTATSVSLFIHDSHSGYGLFGAYHTRYRKNGCGTFLLMEQIRKCKELGLKNVDFGGINSPNRGDYKMSLSATAVPYFLVSWESSH